MGASHVLIRLLQVSYKYGICSLFTENTILLLSWGGALACVPF